MTDFLREARERGFRLFAGVPCSYLTPLIHRVLDAEDLAYVGAANEGDAVAIASGAALAGVGAVAMMQNSGLGNAVSPLTSLNAIFRIPVLLIVTWRGEPGGPSDEPQHGLMGRITPALLELMGIPWEPFEAPGALDRACAAMAATGLPSALVMRKGALAPVDLRTRAVPRRVRKAPPASWPRERPSRRDVLAAVQEAVGPSDAVVATTGFTGRALYALEDRPSQFYMVGSMGCAAALGLGLAKVRPDRRFVVLDGDGAALMRLGALATVGHEAPANLAHVLLDNEVHDSTGAQATVSGTADLGAVAAACGYDVVRAGTAAEVAAALDRAGPVLIHVKTRPGEAADLPRPSVTPAQVAERFRRWLGPAPPTA